MSDASDRRRSPEVAFFDLIESIQPSLPAGWVASLQMEDPLTHTLEEVATSDPTFRSELLALVPLPDGYTEPPDPWMLTQVGLSQAQVFPLAGESYFGRLLLVADGASPHLDEERAHRLHRICTEFSPRLERARAHNEDQKFSNRLRGITESEIAERFNEACLGLLPSTQAVAVLLRIRGDRLRVLQVQRREQGRIEAYFRHTLPYSGSHLAALVENARQDVRAVLTAEELDAYSEGELFASMTEKLKISTTSTVPLQAGDRLLGSLMLFQSEVGSNKERLATGHLARALALALDRLRPGRRHASSLLYMQHLLRPREGQLEPVLQTVVEEIVRFLGADAGVLALIDAESGRLLLSNHTGYGRRAVLPDVIAAHDEEDDAPTSISAHVMRTGEPYVASDTSSSPIYLPADASIRSEIAVPLRLKGEAVGVALASSRKAGFFLLEDAGRFQLFADQIAVAVDNAHLLDNLRRQREKRTLLTQRRHFGFHPSVQSQDVEYHFGNLVGEKGGAFGQVLRMIERVAAREDDTVLIVGETGTGKDMVSHAIHNASPRRSRPLVATNFAALGGDPNLIQSELFGHEKGSFTGAVRRRKGCFEKAQNSTLLIDELGDIVPSVQVKLLRVLTRSSKREITRLGGEESIETDVRVLAATNKDLRKEMAAGRFREDLYYRLSALVVQIPPLRSRPEDIPLLVRHIMARLNQGEAVRIAKGVYGELQNYPWPGNVRQLESVLLRAQVMFGGQSEITTEDVRQALAVEEGVETMVSTDRLGIECPDPPPEDWFWSEVQQPWKARQLSSEAIRDLLSRHLAATGGYYSKVARRLGVRKNDYQRFIDFLKHSGLKVDYRPFRNREDN